MKRLDRVVWIIVALVYGAGLRLQECLELRVKDLDFERRQIVIRRGKGQKDRPTVLPSAVIERLSRHRFPTDALAFIQRCVRDRNIYWTYHVNVRLAGRYISHEDLLEAVETYEIIESYPEGKYLPSDLVWGTSGVGPFHVLVAADVDGDNVRIVTAYRPSPDEWESDLIRGRSRNEVPSMRQRVPSVDH